MTSQAGAAAPLQALPLRQVHLDFHTSPLIGDVAADFDATAFAHTLRDAHVDSVTLFAVCHHGLCYYPSTIGTVHPHLKRDLLGEQIAACRRVGIRTPAYLTVVWNEEQANRHPAWRQVRPDGRPAGRLPVGPIGKHDWQWLCLNRPYADHVAALVEEVVRGYAVDGLFLDIVMTVQPGCVCAYCRAGMRALDLDPSDADDLRRFALSTERAFMRRISALAQSLRPGLTVFYNSRLRLSDDPALGNRPEAAQVSHWEIESLASGVWGYDHFPLYNRYLQTLGKPVLGMTAAFHRSWADFGTVKSQAALDYESLRMVAGGAACSIGDQMHPRGALNPATYRRIGATFAAIAALEPWARGAVPVAEVGVLLTPGAHGQHNMVGLESELGALHLLMELGVQFQVLDAASDVAPYRVIIAPDTVRCAPSLADRLRGYLAAGGALLLSHQSGLDPDGRGFALEAEVGLDYLGPSRDDVEFLRPAEGLGAAVPAMDHALYERGSAVRAREGTTVLAEVVAPYFSRTWEHFTSHAQTPPDSTRATGLAAATLRGRVAYLSHPLFSAYYHHGYAVYRALVAALLQRLLSEPLVRATLPSTAEVTLLRQAPPGEGEHERLVCHIVHYVPRRRTPDLDLVEDVIPLHDVDLAVRTAWPPRSVYLAPGRDALPATREGAYTHVRVPRVAGHAVVVLER